MYVYVYFKKILTFIPINTVLQCVTLLSKKTNQKQQTPKQQKTLQIVVSLMIFGCHFNMFNNA